MGIVFQFFQLLPTLTILENTLLPMDFCNMYPPAEREGRAMDLLELVGLEDMADKLPGGALGRAAAERGHCPRPGQRSAHPHRRRAHRQPRLRHRAADLEYL